MAEHHQHALLKGYRLGRYSIKAVLGADSFAITYLAQRAGLDQKVAIKEYLPDEIGLRIEGRTAVRAKRGEDDEFAWGLTRFVDEARTLAEFRHPNIVSVTDIFEANGTAYMVTEYVDGESLSKLLTREGTLPEPALRKLLDPLLDALKAVHAEGILHRDIKPANIFIRKDGSPMLLDFGNARHAIGSKTDSLTATLTPGFAPNEQYVTRGKQGPWTDIYAMGAVLYRAVSGEVPPEAPMRLSAYARENGDPMVPASKIGLGRYSIAFLESIDGALRIMEHDRPCSVSEWQDWLAGEPIVSEWQDWLVGEPIANQSPQPGTVVPLERYGSARPARKPPSKGRRRAIAATLALLIASGVASGGYLAYTEVRSRQTAYEGALERERAAAIAAKRKISVLAQRQALADQRRMKAELSRSEAEKTIAEINRRAETVARRFFAVKRKLTSEQRRAEGARRLAILERRRAETESRKRASAEATRWLESKSRRRVVEAQRMAIEAEHKLAVKQRWLLKVERRKAVEESRRFVEAQRKAIEAERKLTAKQRGLLREGRRKAVEESRRLEAVLRKAREARRQAEMALRDYKKKPNQRAKANRVRPRQAAGMPNLNRPLRGSSPGARKVPRAQLANPRRRPFRGRGMRMARAGQLFGRWCGPKGALRFTRTHLVATRDDTGETGRYQLAGYRDGKRAIVVRILLPDGMHRVAFGRFSSDNSRMVELAMKQPGYPWRRLWVVWHRC